MRLKEFRGEIKQKELLQAIKVVDSRVDIGLLSKYENSIALPTPPQLSAICEFLGVEPLDIYSPNEIYLDKHKPDIATVAVKKAVDTNTYVLTARLDRAACKWLDKQVLEKCGYSSITNFVRCCVVQLKKQYDLKVHAELKKAAHQKGKRYGN